METQADGLLTRLFQLTNASVDLINLDFYLAPMRGVVAEDTWSLVSLEGNGRVLLQGVTVTADELGGDLAAVVELLPAPASQMAKDMKMMNMENEGPEASFEVKMYKSFIRGSANVFLSRHTLPGRLEVEQSAIAVDGSLLRAEGDLDMRDDNDHVELTLDHSTCIVGSSLIQMDSGDTPRDLLPVHVRNTRDNLIATNTSNPLVAMSGRSDLDTFQHLLRWDGLKNFYTGFDLFWTVSDPRIHSPQVRGLGRRMETVFRHRGRKRRKRRRDLARRLEPHGVLGNHRERSGPQPRFAQSRRGQCHRPHQRRGGSHATPQAPRPPGL